MAKANPLSTALRVSGYERRFPIAVDPCLFSLLTLKHDKETRPPVEIEFDAEQKGLPSPGSLKTAAPFMRFQFRILLVG